jgi:hypothetical protein
MTDDGDGKPSPVLTGVAGAAIAIALCVWFLQVRSGPARVVALRQCENAYGSARSRADSLAVDTSSALQSRSDAAEHQTCGQLRAAGRLHERRVNP